MKEPITYLKRLCGNTAWIRPRHLAIGFILIVLGIVCGVFRP